MAVKGEIKKMKNFLSGCST